MSEDKIEAARKDLDAKIAKNEALLKSIAKQQQMLAKEKSDLQLERDKLRRREKKIIIAGTVAHAKAEELKEEAMAYQEIYQKAMDMHRANILDAESNRLKAAELKELQAKLDKKKGFKLWL